MARLTEAQLAELANLFHLAATALADADDRSRYARRKWAADAFSKAHPEVSTTRAYKELCRMEAWRYVE